MAYILLGEIARSHVLIGRYGMDDTMRQLGFGFLVFIAIRLIWALQGAPPVSAQPPQSGETRPGNTPLTLAAQATPSPTMLQTGILGGTAVVQSTPTRQLTEPISPNQPPVSGTAGQIQAVILHMNHAQEQALLLRDPSIMQADVAPSVYRDLTDSYLQSLSTGVVAVKLVVLDWGPITVNGDTASVFTWESWTYAYADGTRDWAWGDPNVYHLVLQNGSWTVDSVDQPADVPSLASSAPGMCTDLMGAGCPLPFETVTAGALHDPSDVDRWLLTTSEMGALRVDLLSAPASSRLTLRAPDSSVVGQVIAPELRHPVEISLPSVPPGTYEVDVDNPGGVAVGRTYTVLATRPGHVVLADSLADAGSGLLPTGSDDPAFQVGFDSGEYAVRQIDQSAPSELVDLPIDTTDASLSLDARLASADSLFATVVLYCRLRTDAFHGFYGLFVIPQSGAYTLARVDSDGFTPIATGMSPAIQARTTIRLDLSCVGSQISASLNGQLLAASRDATYDSGGMGFGVTNGGTSGALEARFGNLVVTER